MSKIQAGTVSATAAVYIDQVQAEREAAKKARREADLWADAQGAADDCNSHESPDRYKIQAGVAEQAEPWSMHCDWRAYSEWWIQEGWLPLIAKLRHIASTFELELSSLVEFSLDGVQESRRKQVSLVQELFEGLVRADNPAATAIVTARSVEHVLANDTRSWALFHEYFEALSSQLSTVAGERCGPPKRPDEAQLDRIRAHLNSEPAIRKAVGVLERLVAYPGEWVPTKVLEGMGLSRSTIHAHFCTEGPSKSVRKVAGRNEYKRADLASFVENAWQARG